MFQRQVALTNFEGKMCLETAVPGAAPRTPHRLYRSAQENKQRWSFHWLCKPRDTLSSKKYCSHPRRARRGARGRRGPGWYEKGLFAGGIPGCLSGARSRQVLLNAAADWSSESRIST